MYKGFQVEMTDHFSRYRRLGEEVFVQQNRVIRQCLDKYINLETGSLTGDALERDWFPVSAYDVFISHSHDDAEQVAAFVGWLQEKFQLSVFVDSAVWRSADHLLEKIDARYGTDSEGDLDDYRRRNFHASHVYMMMAMALGKVIDQTECFMFVTTPNAVMESVTRSPWLYVELMFTKLMKKRVPLRRVAKRESKMMAHQEKQLEVEYDVRSLMSELLVLRKDNLQLWEKMYQHSCCDHALDVLYAQFDEGVSR